MERDLRPAPGDDDPLDAALGELPDLADLEQRFAVLDARAARSAGSPDDDPFADIEAVLREQRATSHTGDDLDEASTTSLLDDDDDVDDHSDLDLDPEDELAEEIELRCQEALDSLDDGNASHARDLAMEAVRLDDEHPFPLFVLGLVAERDGDLDTASDMAELALRTAETNPDAIGLRAHIHVRRHEFDAAEALLRFGITHNPDEANLHEGLARVLLATGDHDAALVAATAALRLEPSNGGALGVRAAAFDAAVDRTSLLAVLRQGVQLHPEDPYAMVELAAAEMEHGHHERARILLARAHRLAPRDAEIADLRGLIEHARDRRFLQPVPATVRWIREFPGGMPGFLVGFLIAALPLHALAVAQPDYRWPAITALVVWGAVAMYAWIAPSMLSRHLDRRAATIAAGRLDDDLRDPLGTVPPAERVCDTASLLVDACQYRRAAELLVAYADRLDPTGLDLDDADRYRSVARGLRSTRTRLARLLLVLPGLARALVALAAILAVSAPLLADLTSSNQLAVWYGASLLCLGLAEVPRRVRARHRDRVEDALTAARLTSDR